MKTLVVTLMLISQILMAQYKIIDHNFGSDLSVFKDMALFSEIHGVKSYTKNSDTLLVKYPFLLTVYYVFSADKLYMITLSAKQGMEKKLLTLATSRFGPCSNLKGDERLWYNETCGASYAISTDGRAGLFIYDIEMFKRVTQEHQNINSR